MNKSIKLLTIILLLFAINGCMTTTQKGAAVGTGAGALLGAGIGALTGHPGMGALIGGGLGAAGGALVGDNIDNKREEMEKAQHNREIEMETVKTKDEEETIYTRKEKDGRWLYSPTLDLDQEDLYRKTTDDSGTWVFIPLD